MPTLEHYLFVSGLLFAIGMTGVIIRRNALVTLMALEINLNAANLAAVAFSQFKGHHGGQIFYLFIIAIAAAEVAVGLAIFVALFKAKQTLDVNTFKEERHS